MLTAAPVAFQTSIRVNTGVPVPTQQPSAVKSVPLRIFSARGTIGELLSKIQSRSNGQTWSVVPSENVLRIIIYLFFVG